MKNKGVYIGESTAIFTYDGDNLKEIKSEREDSDGGSWNIKHTYIKHDKNPIRNIVLFSDMMKELMTLGLLLKIIP